MNLKQFVALVRLRFQLSLNQIRKGGTLNSALFSIIAVGLVLVILSSFASAIFVGAVILSLIHI